MRRSDIVAFSVAALIAGTACGQGAPQTPIVVGAVVSQSGLATDLADGYRKGILLWQAQLNAAGGLIGRPVELRLIDDHSGANEAAQHYDRLIAQDKVDLLIGPYGSAASVTAAAVAESAGRVMVNGSGASGAVHKRGLRYVFQLPVPYARYGAGVPELARRAGAAKLFVVARADPVAREMADALLDEARRGGLAAGALATFNVDVDEFDDLVKQARAQRAEAWVAFGSPRDAANMVISFKRLGYAPKLFVARGVEAPEFIRRVGQDAEYAIGISAWEPSLTGEGNAAFVAAYRARWSAEPTLASVQGYGAGRVLEEAVRRAGSIDPEPVRAALAALATRTPLGPYRVEAGTGRQLAAHTMLVQILKGRREIVWPAALASASADLPYRGWDQRKLIAAGE